MAKVRLEKENTRNPMLFSTSVENLFISELLPAAPGNFVKVYLLGLMNAEYGISPEMTSTVNVLNMTVEEIESAWAYWEEKGAVRRVYDPSIHSYRIRFISQIEELYGEEHGRESSDVRDGGNAPDTGRISAAHDALNRTTTDSYTRSDVTGSRSYDISNSENVSSSVSPGNAGKLNSENFSARESRRESTIPASTDTRGGKDAAEDASIAGIFLSSGGEKNPAGRGMQSPFDGNDEMDELARLEEVEIAALYEQVMEAKGGTISPRDMSRIRDAVRIYSVNPDVYSYAIKYCRELQKYDVNYITNVALRWKEKGCEDIAQVKNLLDKESRRNAEYKSIFQAVGFHRAWTPADREMMNTWLDEWGFSMADVLDACRTTAGMRDPDLRYVNRVLQNKMKEAGGIDTRKDGSGNRSGGDSYQRSVSKRVLGAYYEYLRNEAELEYQNHIETAKREIPQIADVLALENELNKAIMMSFSFNAKAKEERQTQIQKRKELDQKKRRILKEHGYPEDYLDKKFKCERCKDTGITDDGQYCSCTKERVNEAYRWNLKRTRN